MNSCIYNGEVTHTRFKPVRHFLKYKTFSLLVDLDEISQLDSNNLDNEDSLPLADPFEEMSNSSIDSTDDLMEVFESSSSSQSMLQGQGGIIPFIPPYSVTPDNLKITNRATYRRVQR